MEYPIRSTPRGWIQAAIYGEVVRKFQDFVSPERIFFARVIMPYGSTYERTDRRRRVAWSGPQAAKHPRWCHSVDNTYRDHSTVQRHHHSINCYVFVVSDAQMSIEGNQLKSRLHISLEAREEELKYLPHIP